MKRLALMLIVLACVVARAEPIVVASKNFNESYILGEILAQLLEREGFEVERKLGLGGTLICYQALVNGEIDVYPEYTGTISRAIMQLQGNPNINMLRGRLRTDGIDLLPPFGFNNTYAIAVSREIAERHNLQRVSDLVAVDDLNVSVSHEFLEREDGWPGLVNIYGITLQPRGIEHALAYQAIADGTIDLTDAYSTDGEIARYGLVLLEDDLAFFPSYLAAPLVRTDLDGAAQAVLKRTANTLTDAAMQALNAAVLYEGETFGSVARRYLDEHGLGDADADTVTETTWVSSLIANTLRHLELTGIALLAATVVGIALSLTVFRNAWLSRAIVYVAGLMQTIPSIALLALFIPVFGIGMVPAIVALFLYSLLPILRNSITALVSIDPVLQRVARAIGMSRGQQMRYVYVPLAMPSILAGIRTAAVISIGTATLAAFIGAGGLGDPIVTGLALNDTRLILEGAIPAAVLAILVEIVFEGVERLLIPNHMRISE